MKDCPCGSELTYKKCCEPLIKGDRKAETPEQVMRARYSAHVKVEMDYLQTSLHPDKRADYDNDMAREWSENAEWQGLEIISTQGGGVEDDEGEVEFTAKFIWKGENRDHHERAHFSKEDGDWYFIEGEAVKSEPFIRPDPKVGRNDPCPCGSGKKYKKCCAR